MALTSLHRVSPAVGLFARRSASSSAQPGSLDWPTYLAIRRAKRKWELATTYPATALGLVAGISYFGQLESTGLIMGVEPLYLYGAGALGCCGLGYLLGPILGSSAWRLSHSRTMPLIEVKDREFHKHIVKNRVDPTAQSASNPVPDFYGEKIGSLHQYRQWLRDQSRYRKKAIWPED